MKYFLLILLICSCTTRKVPLQQSYNDEDVSKICECQLFRIFDTLEKIEKSNVDPVTKKNILEAEYEKFQIISKITTANVWGANVYWTDRELKRYLSKEEYEKFQSFRVGCVKPTVTLEFNDLVTEYGPEYKYGLHKEFDMTLAVKILNMRFKEFNIPPTRPWVFDGEKDSSAPVRLFKHADTTIKKHDNPPRFSKDTIEQPVDNGSGTSAGFTKTFTRRVAYKPSTMDLADSFHTWYTGLPENQKISFVKLVLQAGIDEKYEAPQNADLATTYAKRLKDQWNSSGFEFYSSKLIYKLPDSMAVDDDDSVVLRVFNTNKDSILYLSFDTTKYKSDSIKILSTVTVTLFNSTADSNFYFRCLDPARQPILPNGSASWEYTIRALKPGQKLPIKVLIATTISVESKDEELVVKEYPKNIFVEGSIWWSLKAWVDDNWKYLVAAAAIIAWFIGLGIKKKENNKTAASTGDTAGPDPKVVAKTNRIKRRKK